MRSVQVVDRSSDQTTRAEQVIGIDESGNVTGPGPFALVAVRSARTDGERFAELLIENDLDPWRAKSKTLASRFSRQERDSRVESLLDSFAAESIQWSATIGYDRYTIHEKAAAVCVLAKKTITGVADFQGDSVLIPDGSDSMYGHSQEKLRRQASQFFDGSFQSVYGEAYVSALAKADFTYPEVAAADYIAGYLRDEVALRGETPASLPDQVIRFDKNWREPRVSPLPFYALRPAAGDHGTPMQRRIIAWIKGRHPDGDEFDVSNQYENTVNQMLESESVKQYLLDVST